MTSFLRIGLAAAVAAGVLAIAFAPGVSGASTDSPVIAAQPMLPCDIYGAAHTPAGYKA